MRVAGVALALAVASAAADASVRDWLAMPWESSLARVEKQEATTYRLPLGPFRDGIVPTLSVDGGTERTIFRLDSEVSTLELFRAVSDSLQTEGFEEIFRCDSRECGGFDFRANIDVSPPSEMFVDLGDFRFVAAWRNEASGPVFIDALVSRSDTSGFIQVTESWGTSNFAAPTDGPAEAAGGGAVDSVAGALSSGESAVLEGIVFASGSTELGETSSEELAQLAELLKSNPDLSAALVGHTDTEGTLQANIELSQQRARSVMRALVDTHGVDPGQMSAHGIGYLSPRAANSTPEGRKRNRRVEVVIVGRE